MGLIEKTGAGVAAGPARRRDARFEVPADWQLPDLGPADVHAGATIVDDLTIAWVDTEDAALRRFGVTLSHQSAGHLGADGAEGADAIVRPGGWWLEVHDGPGRARIHSNAAPGEVPEKLARRVAGLVGERRLDPVAVVTVRRRLTPVLDQSSAVVAWLVDDQSADPALPWRELEVVLSAVGAERHLTLIGRWLTRAGAVGSAGRSSLDRMLADPGVDPGTAGDPVAQAVRAYVRQQCRDILLGDLALRDRPSSKVVHRTRVAIRTLRSILRTHWLATAVADSQVASLRSFDDDLRALAAQLGPIRDGDVVGQRLMDEISELPPELVLGPVVREIEETVAIDRRGAIDRLRVAWTEPAYQQTLDRVAGWHSEPEPTTFGAPRGVLRRAERTVRRRLEAAGADPDDLHRARKAAKRLRYTAELYAELEPRARKSAHRAQRLQTELGEHQDLVVAASYLRRLAVEHGSAQGHNGFTYGLLHADMEYQAAMIRARFHR